MVIKLVSTMHIIQGLLLALSATAGNATALFALSHIMPTSMLSALLVSTGLLGLVRKWWAAVPQQIVLSFSAVTILMSIFRGQYADGTVINSMHIAADQLIILLLAVMYPYTVAKAFEIDRLRKRYRIAHARNKE